MARHRNEEFLRRVADWWQARPSLSRWLLVLSVSLAGVYSLRSGFMGGGAARHIDTAYFFAAGKCWVNGGSPYDFAFYSETFDTYFDIRRAPFVFPPTIVFFCLPLGFVDWEIAQHLWDLFNALALAALIAVCLKLQNAYSTGPRVEPFASLWLLLGLTILGIPGTLLTGQAALFPALGIGLLLLGLKRASTWAIVIGVILASIKPQLSLIVVGFLFFATFRRATTAWIIAATSIAVISLVVFSIGGHGWSDYLASLGLHLSSDVAKFDDVTTMHGLASSFVSFTGSERMGLAMAQGVLGVLLVGFASAWLLGLKRLGRDGAVAVKMIVVLMLLSIIAMPIKAYDIAFLASAYSLLGLLPLRQQAWLLPGALLIWRVHWPPRILDALFGVTIPDHVVFATGFSLVLTTLAILLLGEWRRSEERLLV